MEGCFKYLVKKGGKYTHNGTKNHYETSDDIAKACIWTSYLAAVSFAEEIEAGVYKLFEDGYEKLIGPNFER